jgi:hypothetical protein
MILKLFTYADLQYNGDPALIPLIKSQLEQLIFEILEEAFKTDFSKFCTEGLFDEIPEGLPSEDYTVKFLEQNVVRLRQIQQIRETQNNLNKKKLRTEVSITKEKKRKTPSKTSSK